MTAAERSRGGEVRSSSWIVESYKIEQDLGEKTMHEPRLEHGKNEVEHSPV